MEFDHASSAKEGGRAKRYPYSQYVVHIHTRQAFGCSNSIIVTTSTQSPKRRVQPAKGSLPPKLLFIPTHGRAVPVTSSES